MAAKTLQVKIPSLPSGLAANLLGVLGLIGFAVAVGGLTHNWWWSLALASVEAVLLSVVATMNAEDEPAEDEQAHPADLVRRRTG